MSCGEVTCGLKMDTVKSLHLLLKNKILVVFQITRAVIFFSIYIINEQLKRVWGGERIILIIIVKVSISTQMWQM